MFAVQFCIRHRTGNFEIGATLSLFVIDVLRDVIFLDSANVKKRQKLFNQRHFDGIKIYLKVN